MVAMWWGEAGVTAGKEAKWSWTGLAESLLPGEWSKIS